MNIKNQAIIAITALGRANNHILHQQLSLPGACETLDNMDAAFDLVNEALDSLRSIVKHEEAQHANHNDVQGQEASSTSLQ